MHGASWFQHAQYTWSIIPVLFVYFKWKTFESVLTLQYYTVFTQHTSGYNIITIITII